MAEENATLPLFPLHTVLLPGGVLPLRIFEPRYLDMVSRCLRQESGFGVVLIRDGDEVGRAAHTHEVGTLGRISWFERRRDGLLGITVTGERRFRIRARDVGPDQLLSGRVQLLPEAPAQPLPEAHAHLAELLRRLLESLEPPYRTLPPAYEDAGWVGGRLIELLPLPLVRKQHCLELDDPLVRLEELRRYLERK